MQIVRILVACMLCIGVPTASFDMIPYYSSPALILPSFIASKGSWSVLGSVRNTAKSLCKVSHIYKNSDTRSISRCSMSSSSRNKDQHLNPDYLKERHIILLCHNVSENVGKGLFRPNNLLEGRVDVMCRCITNAIYYSNGVRRYSDSSCVSHRCGPTDFAIHTFSSGMAVNVDPRDTWVWILLQPLGITIEVAGDSVLASHFPVQ